MLVLALGLWLHAAPAISPENEAEENVERRAGLLTGVGCAFAVGGGVALGVGIEAHVPWFEAAGTVLVAVAVHAVFIAVFSWIWPDDSWLHIFSQPVLAPRRLQ
jgi:hypothetical protein